jgi:hypothetical protein
LADKRKPLADLSFVRPLHGTILGKITIMRNLIILTIGLFCAQQGMAQNPDWKKIKEANADKILMSGPRKPTKVLLLGTSILLIPIWMGIRRILPIL